MYGALSPGRAALPPLSSVRSILLACLGDEGVVGERVSAWQAVSLREFTRSNPAPAGGAWAPLRAVSGQ
jgi:hypothetical protein